METRLPDAIFVLWDVRTLNFRQFIIDFALKHNLPTSMPRAYVEAGGLISYGPNVTVHLRRSATMRTESYRRETRRPPGRATVEATSVNLKTAEKLRLKLLHALLLLADRVIQ